MKSKTFQLEIITPCFCGGADPEKHAEIRAPSIRGQLRWWFRTLGGFKSLAPTPVRRQEDLVFGSTAGDSGKAGLLIVRVESSDLKSQVSDGQRLGHRNFSDSAYLTFPVQSREKDGHVTQYAGRGVFTGGTFKLTLLWKGTEAVWSDLLALTAVFGHFGALGFRGRRAMGALAFRGEPAAEPAEALTRFNKPEAIKIKELPATSSANAISVLGAWLRSCRSHGRSGQNQREKDSPFFEFAKRDHDIGYAAPCSRSLPAFRPALGLPIIQRTAKGTNNWDEGWNLQKQKGEGRFASPVLLRPYKDSEGKWRALVIFVDGHAWPQGKQVFFNGQPRAVSLDLYNKMKADSRLVDFQP